MEKLTLNQQDSPFGRNHVAAETDLEMQARLEHERTKRLCGNAPLRKAVAQLQTKGKPGAEKPGCKAALRRLKQQQRRSGVAQLVEQRPVTPPVAGSSPAPGAKP